MSMEFMRNALFGKVPHAAPVTLTGELPPAAMRTELAKRLGCSEDRVEQALKRLLGKPESATFKPTQEELKALLKRDLERDKETPCRKRGAAEKGTGPDPATRNDSTKDGNEPSERSGNV